MNIFRLIGDLLHTCAIVFLPVSILRKKSYTGVSHRTQLLLCMVFIARYMDLFEYHISIYNSVMKVLFISLTMITFLMGCAYNNVEIQDNFKSESLVFFAMVSALLNCDSIKRSDILWSFSEYLEALAIIPQIYLILRTKKITKAMIIYMMCTAFYKIFYFFNWAYRYNYENYLDTTSDVAGMTFISVYGIALLMMLCSGVKTYNENNEKGNIFSRMTLPPMVFSISSKVDQKMNPDKAPLVMEDELTQKEKGIIQTV